RAGAACTSGRSIMSSLKNLFALAALAVSTLSTACAAEPNDTDDASDSTESAVFAPPRVRFEKLFACDDGAAYVDVNVEERRYLQLVIKDTNILRYLQQRGAVSLSFGATEASFRGFTGVHFYQDFGPKLAAGNPYGGRGVFAPAEFSHFIAEYNN